MRLNAFIIAIALLLPVTAPAAQPIVQTRSGSVRGEAEGKVDVFRGLPYAQPPVGSLRWRDPRAPERWEGVRSAAAFAPACLQKGSSMPGEPEPVSSEDCLYLNVWTPTVKAGERKPVLVWFPGGGLTNGATSYGLYDGAALARRDVVVVTVGYRLGVLGYLAHPELTAESGGKGSGNYGLMDQVAALEWVRDNIAAFGGDPDAVTIAGQSAGATSVSILMASPQAKGLFHRAIGQSGGLFEPVALAPHYRLERAEADGVAYAKTMGASSLAELRALPAERFLEAGGDRVVHPVIEPRVLPEAPYETFAAGRQNDVPLLVGFNLDEARSLTDVSGITAVNFSDELTRRWGPLPPALVAPYGFSNDEEAKAARLAFERDLRFGWDIRAWARLQAQHGRRPVYAYLFRHRPPFEGAPREGWGASHFAELWYMFDNLGDEAAWTPADRRLATTMADQWASFVRTGDPNGPDRPHWPAFRKEDERVLMLDEALSPGALPNNRELDAFDAIYDTLR